MRMILITRTLSNSRSLPHIGQVMGGPAGFVVGMDVGVVMSAISEFAISSANKWLIWNDQKFCALCEHKCVLRLNEISF